jgi:hypothetical protein
MQGQQRIEELISPLYGMGASYRVFMEARRFYEMAYPPHMRPFYRELQLKNDKGLNARRVKSLRKFIKFLEKQLVVFVRYEYRKTNTTIEFNPRALPINRKQLLEALKKWEKTKTNTLAVKRPMEIELHHL